jgi:hypothetical protein
MKPGIRLEFRDSIDIVIDISSPHAQPGLTAEMLKTFLKVFGRKCQISIELRDELPVVTVKGMVAFIESFYNAPAGLSKPSV